MILFSVPGCKNKSKNTQQSDGEKIEQTKGELKFFNEIRTFYNIPDDTIITSVFRFRNIGEDTVKIIDYSVTCGCTYAYISDSLVCPKEEGSFTMVVNTRGKGSGLKTIVAVLVTNGKKKHYKLETKLFMK